MSTRIDELFGAPGQPETGEEAPPRSPYTEESSPKRSALSVLLFALFLLWTAHGQILTALGRWLIVSDRPAKADLIVVLSGDAYVRGRQAAELYRQGLAPRLLVTGNKVSSSLRMLGLSLTDAEIAAKGLQELGVPEEDLVVVSSTGSSTWEEATYARQYAVQERLRSVLVVTSKFHTRRAKLSFEKALKGTGVRVRVVPSQFDESENRKWWTRERELIEVNNEYLKLLFYMVKHFPSQAR